MEVHKMLYDSLLYLVDPVIKHGNITLKDVSKRIIIVIHMLEEIMGISVYLNEYW